MSAGGHGQTSVRGEPLALSVGRVSALTLSGLGPLGGGAPPSNAFLPVTLFLRVSSLGPLLRPDP